MVGASPRRRWPGRLSVRLVGALFLASTIWGGCQEQQVEPERVGPAPSPASVKGLLRVGVYGDGDSTGSELLRQTSVFVNGPDYRGMEDNDLRGFLDGRFMYGVNQPGQVHVRAGRRQMHSKAGEVELFLEKWAVGFAKERFQSLNNLCRRAFVTQRRLLPFIPRASIEKI